MESPVTKPQIMQRIADLSESLAVMPGSGIPEDSAQYQEAKAEQDELMAKLANGPDIARFKAAYEPREPEAN